MWITNSNYIQEAKFNQRISEDYLTSKEIHKQLYYMILGCFHQYKKWTFTFACVPGFCATSLVNNKLSYSFESMMEDEWF